MHNFIKYKLTFSFFIFFNLLLLFFNKNAGANENYYPDGLRITTYNTMLLPKEIMPNYAQYDRANLISSYDFFGNQDVIVLQELFDKNSSSLLLSNFSKNFPYQTPIVGKSFDGWDATLGRWNSFTPVNGGVAIISKWPIIEKKQYLFNKGCGVDYFSLKGFAYAKIDFNGTYYHVIGTHLQSDDNYCGTIEDEKIRKLQLNEISKFIKDQNIPSNDFLIIAGDMNIDKEKISEYQNMIETLNVNEPKYLGLPYSFDTVKNGIAIERYENYKKENLDYIFVSRNHRKMPYWHNIVLDPVTKQWNVFSQNRTWSYVDASDHFPVIAFSYADQNTPSHSFVPENGSYEKVYLKNIESGKYVQAGDYPHAPLKLGSQILNPLNIFHFSNNFSMRDNGCIQTNDFLKIESKYFPGNFWSPGNKNLYEMKSGLKSSSTELKIHILNSDNKCLKSGDIIAFIDGNKYLDIIENELEGFQLIKSNSSLSQSGKFEVTIINDNNYIDWSSELKYRN